MPEVANQQPSAALILVKGTTLSDVTSPMNHSLFKVAPHLMALSFVYWNVS